MDRKEGHYAARIGKSVKQQRRLAKVSQDTLAQMAGVSVGTVKAIEQGNGTLRTLLPVLNAIGHKLVVRHGPGDDLITALIVLRKRHGMSVRALARLLGLSRSTVANVEGRGESRISTVADYAAAVGAGLTIVPVDHSPAFFTSTGNHLFFTVGIHPPIYLQPSRTWLELST